MAEMQKVKDTLDVNYRGTLEVRVGLPLPD
jgi:hypothetical protein